MRSLDFPACACACACILGSAVMPARACFSPADQWAAGVAWNNGETVDPSKIDPLGVNGTDYVKKGAGDSVVYTYRSHFAPGVAMVYLGYYAISFQPAGSVPRLAVILDTMQNAKAFDFGAAVRVELDWLCNPEVGVVSMTMADRQRAQDSITGGDLQYWTKQKRALSYNMWYTGDSLGGVWGVNGVRGGCGLDQAYEPPPKELSLAGAGTEYTVTFGNARFAVNNVETGDLTMVDAIREPDGSYFLIFMSRWPSFMNKFVTGYFEHDTIPMMDMVGDIFIVTEVLRDVGSKVLHGSAGRLVAGSVVGRLTASYDIAGRRVMSAPSRLPRGATMWQTPQGLVRRVDLQP